MSSAASRLTDAPADPSAAARAGTSHDGRAARDAQGAPAPAAYGPMLRFELVKLLAQWRIRVLLVLCWLGPAAAVALLTRQASLPADTVFGRWMFSSGWADSLAGLAFACTWALPLLAALVAGDVFAIEDRQGTWRHLVTVVRSARRIFVAKTAATAIVLVVLLLGMTVSSIVGGLAIVGNHDLPALDGRLIPPASAAPLVLLAWGYVALATFAYAAVGLLGSVALGRSPLGLLAPAVLAFVLQTLQMLPLPVPVALALPSQAYLAWRGLFVTPTQTGPLVVGLLVSLAWIVLATYLAYRLFMRRDFTDLAYDGGGRRALLVGVVPLVALLVVSMLAIVPVRGDGITRAKVESSLATSFAHLYRLQTAQLHRPDVTEEQLATAATCDKGGSRQDGGPGNDWRCVVTWHLPGATAVGSALYQLDVSPDGRYVADGDGPKEVNGYFRVQSALGDSPNPLWQIDGLVDLLSRTSPEE